MPRPTIAAIALLLAAASIQAAAGPKNTNTSARVTIADHVTIVDPAAPDNPTRLRSDLLGDYVDGADCVQAWYAARGNFFLRTVTSALPPCGPDVARTLVLDFSDRVWPDKCAGPESVTDATGLELDTCGINAVADARLVADRLFSATATRLDVPFSLSPDFRNTAFELTYVQTLTVEQSGVDRTMIAAPSALAELYAIAGRTKTLLGRYRMPARITVTAR